jgi:TrpR-related protein YerC/YecD
MTYTSRYKDDQMDDLFEVILALETEEDCYRFFEDLMTVKEMQSIAQRWQVVKKLDENKTYVEIEEETGASTATISRIAKCLSYGAGGYRQMIDKLNGDE